MLILQVSEECCQVGAEVPGGERPEKVWPPTELPAPAEEQGELGDSSRGRQGNQEEHRVAPRQGKPEVKPSDVLFLLIYTTWYVYWILYCIM